MVPLGAAVVVVVVVLLVADMLEGFWEVVGDMVRVERGWLVDLDLVGVERVPRLGDRLDERDDRPRCAMFWLNQVLTDRTALLRFLSALTMK